MRTCLQVSLLWKNREARPHGARLNLAPIGSLYGSYIDSDISLIKIHAEIREKLVQESHSPPQRYSTGQTGGTSPEKIGTIFPY